MKSDYVRNRKKRRHMPAPINMTCTVMRVHVAARLMVTFLIDIPPKTGPQLVGRGSYKTSGSRY